MEIYRTAYKNKALFQRKGAFIIRKGTYTVDVKKIIKFLGLNIIGSVLYGLGIHAFTAPQQIAPGGASGIGILVNYVTGFPIGMFTFIFNIPLLACIFGGYSEGNKQVIFCALGKNEYATIKKMIHKVAPHAFVIITDASEVIGNGFKSMI